MKSVSIPTTEPNSAFPPTWSMWECEFTTVTGSRVSRPTTSEIGAIPMPESKRRARSSPRTRYEITSCHCFGS